MLRNVLSGLVVVAVVGSASVADAKKPEDVFGGKIMTSDAPYPIAAKSPGAYITQVKKQSRSRFDEDKDNKRWKIYYAAFFKKKLNDLEITVNLYDLTGGGQRLVESYQQYLTKKGERVIVGNITLDRSDTGSGYAPNSQIRMEMLSGGKVIATATFTVSGEAKRYSGKAEFTEEEARGGEIKNDPVEEPKKEEPKKKTPKK